MQDVSHPAAPDAPASRGRPLAQAVVTGAILVAIIGLGSWLGKAPLFVLICVVVETALFEFLDGLKQSGRRPNVPFTLACGLAMLGVAYLERPSLVAVVVGVTAFGGLMQALRRNRGTTPASDVAWMVLGVTWITGGGAAAVGILVLNDVGVGLVVAFILIAAVDDTTAYFVGTRFGKHKMAPSISPGKSWEGFAGGFAAALVGGVVASAVLDELTLPHGLAVAAICGVFAPFGDLVESLFKREMGIKDSGRLLPGHGGFLDRIDAMIFCAPWVLLFLHLAVV